MPGRGGQGIAAVPPCLDARWARCLASPPSMSKNAYRLIGALGFALLHCGGSTKSATAVGEEREHCYPNGTCNDGLTCFSNLCVKYDMIRVQNGSDAATVTMSSRGGAAG